MRLIAQSLIAVVNPREPYLVLASAVRLSREWDGWARSGKLDFISWGGRGADGMREYVYDIGEPGVLVVSYDDRDGRMEVRIDGD